MNTPPPSPGATLIQVHSEAMDRDFPVLIYRPDDYESSENPLPVVYVLHGFTKYFTEHGPTEKPLWMCYPPGHRMIELANEWRVTLVAPATGNHYYLDSPVDPKVRFETYIGKELPAAIDDQFRTTRDRNSRILAGFSMGGYGALRLICRYPDTFCAALTRGASLNMAERARKQFAEAGEARGSWIQLLGDFPACEQNYIDQDPLTTIELLAGRDDVGLVVECGVDDGLIDGNRQMHEKLLKMNFPHIYTEYPGGHVWGLQPFRSLLTALQQFRPTINPAPAEALVVGSP